MGDRSWEGHMSPAWLQFILWLFYTTVPLVSNLHVSLLSWVTMYRHAKLLQLHLTLQP